MDGALVSIGKLKYLFPHADYPNDLNACARDLTREGYKFHVEQLDNDLWCGYFTEDGEIFAKLIGWNRSDKLAVAWCEAFLALDKYIKESKS